MTAETSEQNLLIVHVYFGTGPVGPHVGIVLKTCILLSAATPSLMKGNGASLTRAKDAPNVGLEPTTLGLRVPCSTD